MGEDEKSPMAQEPTLELGAEALRLSGQTED